MNKVLKIAVLSLMLVAGLAACSSPTEPSSNSAAPDFKLADLNGNTVALSDLRGKPVLLNFWATWCPPCREEVPLIEEINQEWTSKGLVVLTVSLDDSADTVKDFVQNYGLTFTVLHDREQRVAQTYGIQGIPTTLFIDKDGNIRARTVGAFPNKAAIETGIKKIMP
ncbi:MAG: TlpA disulfide reductase family protein [Chloroflexota bacterium]|nr:TlpA disulfide reductase family protein [Chloroflexota bacterium]